MKPLATLAAVAVFLASMGMASPTTGTPPVNSFKEPSLIVSTGDPNKPLCLTTLSSNDGTAVITDACDDARNKWIFANGGLKWAATKDTHDVCLDVTDNCGEDGTKLQLWKCHGGVEQQWAYDEANQWFVWTDKKNKKYCLDLTNHMVGAGVQLWSCYGNNPNQKWTPRASTTTKGDPTPTGASKEIAAHDGHGAEGAKEGAKDDVKTGAAKGGETAGQSTEGNFFASFKSAVDNLVKKYTTSTGK